MKDKRSALKLIKESLNKIGYDSNKIIDGYPITTIDENVIYFDFIAFGHNKIQDTSTSCISVKYCEDETEEEKIIEYAKYSASPFLIMSQKEKIKLCKLNVEKKLDNIIEIKYDELGEYFSENRVKFDYSKILSSKYENEQVTLFDTNNLFVFASKINCKLLGREFEKAILSVKNIINEKDSEQITDITSIVMHVIAAKILNDKLLLKERYLDIHELLKVLSNTYGDYFSIENLYKYGTELIDIINDSFSKEFSYRSIDNEILGNFYESTLFESDDKKNKELKRKWGIYYTPSCIVNNMLKSMPIELIDYRKRYTLDASCGSGSLLIGAYKKLKQLLPKKMDEEIQHQYLTDRLLGIDIDKFACEVARLELLLNSIPYGKGWNVKSDDFLKINSMNFKPNIIIANPPYEEKRKEKIEQKAALFLDKYIDLLDDDGILCIVLPQTFLSNKSCKSVRKKLLENIQLYEIWLLPGGVFDTNNCFTTVIIGRKRKNIENKPFKGKITVQKSVDKFKKTGKFDLEFICEPQMNILDKDDYSIVISPLEPVLKKISNNHKLGEYVDYTRGLEIPYDDYPLLSDEYKDGYSKFFRNAKLGFQQYYFDWEKQKKSKYIKYDPENPINHNNMKRNGKRLRLREEKRYIFEKRKIVVSANSTPGTFWRVKAAIDKEGVYVSHSLWCFVSNNEMNLEVIMAVLNSKLSNVYVENTNVGRYLRRDNILNIPFPKLTDSQKGIITDLVKNIEAGICVEENKDKIDKIIYSAFELSDSDINAIESYYAIFNYDKFKEINESNIDTIQVTGKIKKVDFDNRTLEAMFVECDEIKIIKITKQIPGWLLVEDAPFVCRISEDDFYEDEVEIIDVEPIQYTYLSDSDVSSLVINHYNNYENRKEQIKFVKEGA